MRHTEIRRYLRHGTLPQLQVFEAVARHGSYTRAAEELHMAQPTVSVQIKKLTQTVGLPLLEHVGKRVHMTAAGRELNRACSEVFAALTAVEQALSDLRGLKSGTLRVAVTSTGKYLGTRLLAGFVKRHPGIALSLHLGSRRELQERLACNTDDLYLFGNPPGGTEVVVQRILPNPFYVYARIDHPLARDKAIPFERIACEPIVMRERGSGTRLVTEHAFAARGLKPNVIMEVASDEGIEEAIRAGLGIAVLSQHALGFAPPRQLARLDVAGFPFESHWHLVYAAGKQPAPVARAFLDFARDHAAEIMSTAHADFREPPASHPSPADRLGMRSTGEEALR